MLEIKQDAAEERFDELHSHLGHQYCHGLEPSVVGYERCVAHLLLEQARTYLVIAILLVFSDRMWKLICIFVVQNAYYLIQLAWVRAEPRELRMTGWINFTFSMLVNYYQLITLVEV